MTHTSYVALLRGINVGGKNIIKMAELKECLLAAGFENVSTYIQSGNVLFTGPVTDAERLERELTAALHERFAYQAPVAVRSLIQMQEIISRKPKGFGDEPDLYRSEVIYLIKPLTPSEAMKIVKLKEGVDAAAKGPDVLYFARLTARAGQSYISRIVGTPAYQHMTIRNWNTTTKILAMMVAMDLETS